MGRGAGPGVAVGLKLMLEAGRRFHGPIMQRFVLQVAASVAPDESGRFWMSVAKLAAIIGTDPGNVRKALRALEGRPGGQGEDRGRWLYPEKGQAMAGDTHACEYRLVPPQEDMPRVLRQARNPHAIGCEKGWPARRAPSHWVEPDGGNTPVSQTGGIPPTPPVSQTGGISPTPPVSQTGDPGLPNRPPRFPKPAEQLNNRTRRGSAPPIPPEGEEGRAGENPRPASPPTTTTTTPAEAMRARAEALRRKAQEAIAAEQGQRGEIGDETITPPSADEPAA